MQSDSTSFSERKSEIFLNLIIENNTNVNSCVKLTLFLRGHLERRH